MKGPTIAACLALLCVAGCNQEDPADPDDGSMEPEAGGGGAGAGGSSAELEDFPLRDGASWTYQHTNRGGWTETVRVEATAEANGFRSIASVDPDGVSSESVFEVVDGDVLRVSEDTFVDGALDRSATYDPGFVRFSQRWADAEPGFSERLTYQRTETVADAAPSDPNERAHVFTVESVTESVTSPAGTFRNCVRVHRKRDYETMSGGMTVVEDQEKLYWFCPGVGKVREENPALNTYELLLEYDLPEE